MTRILFVCQGNTCRSPLAEVIARHVFGPNHSLASAGTETAEGEPPARYAMAVAKEMGLDLTSHRTRSIDSYNLSDFDVLVPMDRRITTMLAVPSSVRLEQFDIDDPYGKPLEQYRATARTIQRNVRRLYAADSLFRLASAKPPRGSHALGVVVRAAKEFEKETALIVKTWRGKPEAEKLPLGRLARALERKAARSSEPNAPTMRDLAAIMEEVNKAWIQLKHRDDPPLPDLIHAAKLIIKGFDLVAAIGPPSLPLRPRRSLARG